MISELYKNVMVQRLNICNGLNMKYNLGQMNKKKNIKKVSTG